MAYTATPVIDFHNVEVGNTSAPFTAVISSIGEDPLEITSIPSSVGPFQLINTPGFPVTLNTNESIMLDFVFTPLDTGYFEEQYPVTSNDPNFPELSNAIASISPIFIVSISDATPLDASIQKNFVSKSLEVIPYNFESAGLIDIAFKSSLKAKPINVPEADTLFIEISFPSPAAPFHPLCK